MLKVIRIVNPANKSTEKCFIFKVQVYIHSTYNRENTGNSYLESLILLVTQLRYKIVSLSISSIFPRL